MKHSLSKRKNMNTTNINSESIGTGGQPLGVRNATLRALELRLAAQIAEGDPQMFTTAKAYRTKCGPLPQGLENALLGFCYADFKKLALEVVAKARVDYGPSVERAEALFGANWDAPDQLESRLRLCFIDYLESRDRWEDPWWREHVASQFEAIWLDFLLSLLSP
jgi:hypothetical protein